MKPQRKVWQYKKLRDLLGRMTKNQRIIIFLLAEAGNSQTTFQPLFEVKSLMSAVIAAEACDPNKVTRRVATALNLLAKRNARQSFKQFIQAIVKYYGDGT